MACKAFYQTEICSVYAAIHTESDLPDKFLLGLPSLSSIPDSNFSGSSSLTATSQLQFVPSQFRNLSLVDSSTSSSQSLTASSQLPLTKFKPRKDKAVLNSGRFSPLLSIPPSSSLLLVAFLSTFPLLLASVPRSRSTAATTDSSSLRLQASAVGATFSPVVTSLVSSQIKKTVVPDSCPSSSQSLSLTSLLPDR